MVASNSISCYRTAIVNWNNAVGSPSARANNEDIDKPVKCHEDIIDAMSCRMLIILRSVIQFVTGYRISQVGLLDACHCNVSSVSLPKLMVESDDKISLLL